MKKIYLLSAVALMGLASCNDFDDQFDLANQIGDKKQVTMELTDADYASISNLAANKALAAELDKSFTDGTTPYTDALKELKNTKYFSTLITADQFLPAFIQDKYPEADVDSKFKVTFNEYCGKSEYLSDFDKLTGEVTLSADDYSTAWEGKSTAAYLTPATMGRMSDVLDERLPDAEEGDMIVVNYAYSDFEPAGGGSSDTPSDGTTKISDVIANTDGGEYAVKGIVCATYSRGFLMTDKTGYILVFKASDVKIGDEVKVTGTTTLYGGLMQFPKKDTELTVEVTKAGKEPNFKHPAYHYLDAAGFEEYVKNPKVEYVRYAGKLTISGNYYNVAVNGTEIQGSLANVPEGKVDASLNGAFVIVHGYAIGATTSKSGTTYLNTMILSVENAANSNSAKARAMRAAANGGANKAVVYKYVGGKWKVYSTDGAKVIAAQPEWYSMIGANTISKPNAYLPTLLQREYPFAEDGQKVAVAYRKAASAMAVKEYTFTVTDGWAESKEYKKETTTFSKSANGIEARISVYMNETLLGNEGGFTIHNVDLGGLSYVWQNTTGYGWKASAFFNKVNTAAESWLVSPAFNFKKAVNPELVFDEALNFLGSANRNDFVQVKVSADFDGENVAAATWEDLTVTNGAEGTSWTFYTVDPISLAQYIGKNIHIAFVYKSTAEIAPTYEFKNIIVREKEEN